MQFAQSRGTVLVADDNPLMRRVVAKALTVSGYRVLEADSGESACQIAEREQGPIDLVLADVVMPTLTTDQLRVRMSACRPKTPVLFMSGYIEDEAVRRRVLHDPVPFLQKPFTLETLTRTVSDLVASRAA
jgi:CheY-like chemotaxis protein